MNIINDEFMLFSRNVYGVRVITGKDKKNVAGIWFEGFGAHCDAYPCPYLTAAAAIGMRKDEVDTFIVRLKKVMDSFIKEESSSSQENVINK